MAAWLRLAFPQPPSGCSVLKWSRYTLARITHYHRDSSTSAGSVSPISKPLQGNIEVRYLCFRYAKGEPFILRNVYLSIRASDHVTIRGPKVAEDNPCGR
jgi:ABC-type bacteriocin/lantibiotic exporter with double-glycine peptidase domain